MAATAASNSASAVPVAATAPFNSRPSPASDLGGVPVNVASRVALAPGVTVPLEVELAVGEGPGVWVAVGGEVLLGVGVRLGVGVMEGVGVMDGVRVIVGVGVLLGVGVFVFVDVGVGVFVGGITWNEPFITLAGTGVADGFDATAPPNVSDEVPPAAPGNT